MDFAMGLVHPSVSNTVPYTALLPVLLEVVASLKEAIFGLLNAKHIRVGLINIFFFHLPRRLHGGLGVLLILFMLSWRVCITYLLTQERHKLRQLIAFPPHPMMPIMYQSLPHVVVCKEERFTDSLRKTGE